MWHKDITLEPPNNFGPGFLEKQAHEHKKRPICIYGFDNNCRTSESSTLQFLTEHLDVSKIQIDEETFVNVEKGRFDEDVLSVLKMGKSRTRAAFFASRPIYVNFEYYSVDGSKEKLVHSKEIETEFELWKENEHIMCCHGYIADASPTKVIRCTENVLMPMSVLLRHTPANYSEYLFLWLDLGHTLSFFDQHGYTLERIFFDQLILDQKLRVKLADLSCVKQRAENGARKDITLAALELLLSSGITTERVAYMFHLYEKFAAPAEEQQFDEMEQWTKCRKSVLLRLLQQGSRRGWSQKLVALVATIQNNGGALSNPGKYHINRRAIISQGIERAKEECEASYHSQIKTLFSQYINRFYDPFKDKSVGFRMENLFDTSGWPEEFVQAALKIGDEEKNVESQLTDEEWKSRVMDEYILRTMPAVENMRQRVLSVQSSHLFLEKWDPHEFTKTEKSDITREIVERVIRFQWSKAARVQTEPKEYYLNHDKQICRNDKR
uniref:RING-type domain-containing protein n=1 Tax=Steinernema glaseri TaxID=37863 RepID=A0A1I7Y7Y8_9BILA